MRGSLHGISLPVRKPWSGADWNCDWLGADWEPGTGVSMRGAVGSHAPGASDDDLDRFAFDELLLRAGLDVHPSDTADGDGGFCRVLNVLHGRNNTVRGIQCADVDARASE